VRTTNRKGGKRGGGEKMGTRDAGVADVQACQHNLGSTGGLLGGWPRKGGRVAV